MPSQEPAYTVARPAWKFFIPITLITIILAFLYPPMAWVSGILAFYILVFFRDPRRTVPNFPGGLISPADGKVVSIIEVPCPQMPGGRALRIAVFLNIFDVHIQRASYAGRIFDIVRKPGKFINALNEKCSEENEQVTIWLRDEKLTYGIRQIAGAIARRIVCNVKVGDDLARGQRYGLIQFGSRVELFMPLTAEVRVTPGQRVRGGETCLAIWDESKADSSLESSTPQHTPEPEQTDHSGTTSPGSSAGIAPA